MQTFAAIRKKAEARKGGAAALADILPIVKTPKELKAISDDRWLSQMTKCIFCAGFNWTVIDKKWPGFEDVFLGFDPGRLSMLPDDEVDKFLSDARIVRNAQKIMTVRHNAGLIIDLAKEHGSAATFFAEWPDDDFIGLLAFLKKNGARLGGNTAQYFLRFMGRDAFIFSKDVIHGLTAAGLDLNVEGKPPTSKTQLNAVQAAFNAWQDESGWPLAHISKTLAWTVGD
ncbi:MAG: DNA-3-methyladenine glycosylase I [Alphaproteobacteria bacterium]|nr:DNA-3-methyladenine glycosylase I [Alphaproteobacteria bacterium]